MIKDSVTNDCDVCKNKNGKRDEISAPLPAHALPALAAQAVPQPVLINQVCPFKNRIAESSKAKIGACPSYGFCSFSTGCNTVFSPVPLPLAWLSYMPSALGSNTWGKF